MHFNNLAFLRDVYIKYNAKNVNLAKKSKVFILNQENTILKKKKSVHKINITF